MFAVAHKATDRGVAHVLAVRLEEERTKRLQAQKAAWAARQELEIEKEHHRAKAVERSRDMTFKITAQRVKHRPTYRAIEARACRLFHVKQSEIRSDRRDRAICFARQFIMYWSVRLTKLSLPQIGRLMGRDHTTILHGKIVYPEKRAKMGRNLRRVR